MRLVAMSEDGHQRCLFEWAHMQRATQPALRMLFAVPNGGLRDPVVQRKLKEQGLKPGVPDVVLAVARGCWHGMYIELKVPAYPHLGKRAGTTSDDQEMWLEDLHAEGYKAIVCWGWDEARAAILEYLAA